MPRISAVTRPSKIGRLFPAHALGTAVLCMLAVAPCWAGAPDERPAGPGEWGFRPRDGETSAVDPPAFVWRPQGVSARYAIQIAADPLFAKVLYEEDGLPLFCHCPPAPLGAGVYYWRFRSVEGKGRESDWSSARSFRIPEGAVVFPMPSREELLARIPRGHPRLFLRPEGLPRLREQAKTTLQGSWEQVRQACDNLLASPPDITEPPKYPPGVVRGKNDAAWKEIWWGNRVRTVAVTNGAATLAFGYLIGGDERYAVEARRLLLAACSWDPNGATSYRYNDEAGMPFAYYTARAYTWLHDYLGEEDRDAVRRVLRLRGMEIYLHLRLSRHIWKPYSSHPNRAWHWLGEVGTALHGEVEEADDWAWFALNVFFHSYPVWSDDQGGWHEGLAYWNSYLTRATWWLATMKSTYGIDGYRKPFFARTGDFALYVAPPGETQGGFGDLTLGVASGHCRELMTILARMSGNPYWQWYVDRSGGSLPPSGYMGFLFGAVPEVEGKAPVDLPRSRLFPGIGLAVLHDDLVDRASDVQWLLKSSPMGSQSHGYESQNAFLLSVGGAPVFLRSGHRDIYGSPHHKDWMWSTRSVNSILVDGRGQVPHSNLPMGEITRFVSEGDVDFVVAEAGGAYRKRLDRFTRVVIHHRPEVFVILDVLRAPQPSTFQWLLHAPKAMTVDGPTVCAQGEKGGAQVRFVAPEGLALSQTNRFDPPPREWVQLEQWHLTAEAAEPARSRDFVTVVRPFFGQAPGEVPPARALRGDGALGCELPLGDGKWVVLWRVEGDGWIEAEGLGTDGELACVVLSPEGEVREHWQVGGTRLRFGDVTYEREEPDSR